jgi:ABC-2 type transport system permease protein
VGCTVLFGRRDAVQKTLCIKENIMRIFNIAIKDLLQIIRDWKAALFLIIMPIGFTLLFGYVFGEQPSDGQTDPRLLVALVDHDVGILDSTLYEILSISETVRPIIPDQDDSIEVLHSKLKESEFAAIVLIPNGYAHAMLEGSPMELELIINTESGSGITAHWAIHNAVSRMQSAVDAARFSTQMRADIKPFSNDQTQTAYLMASLDTAATAWKFPPVSIVNTYSGQDTHESSTQPNGFKHSSPGMMVQFAIAGLIGAAEVLVLERKSGSLRRLLTTPIRRYEILIGHYLAMLVMIFTQFVILIVFAQVFLAVPYFEAPVATFLVAISTAAFAAAMGLLISTISKTSEQVVVYSLVPMFVLSGLGGAWVPLEVTGDYFQKVAYLTPLAWSMTGFRNLVERGQGLESVLFPVAVVTGFTFIVFCMAVWRFRFEEA